MTAFRTTLRILCGGFLVTFQLQGQNTPPLDVVSREVSVLNLLTTSDTLPESLSDVLSREVSVLDLKCVGATCVDDIAFGLPYQVSLTETDGARYFRIRVPPGKRIRVDLRGLDPSDQNALFLRWGAIPSEPVNDFAASSGQSSQQITIDNSPGGDLYILVKGTQFAGGLNTVELRVDILELELTAHSIGHAGLKTQSLRAIIRGAGFDLSTQFSLVRASPPDATISPTAVRRIAPSRVEVTWQLDSAKDGYYHLRATETIGDLESTLPNAFEIRPNNRGAFLVVQVLGYSICRNGTLSTLRVRYQNAGDEEMPTPLLRIEATPADALELRLPPDPDCEQLTGGLCQGNKIFALATHPDGVPGVLGPGAKGEIVVVYRFRNEKCGPQVLDCVNAVFKISALVPPPGAFLRWDQLPAGDIPRGMTPSDWQWAWPELSAHLGPTWGNFLQGMGQLADRLAPRGVHPASFRELFRFAVREALGRPSGAILGTVVSATTGQPITGKSIIAARLGPGGVLEAHSSAMTDTDGAFAIDWLEPGKEYSLILQDHEARTLEDMEAVGVAGDLPALVLLATPKPTTLVPACPNCDESGLPVLPISPPDKLFFEVARFRVENGEPIDPNSKDGTPEPEPPLALGQSIVFRIQFKNDTKEGATRPVQDEVFVEDADALGSRDNPELGSGLSPQFDEMSVQLLDVGIGPGLRPLGTLGKDQLSGYTSGLDLQRQKAVVAFTDQELNGTSCCPVRVDARFEPSSRTLSWRFVRNSIGELPPNEGILPLDGTGYVSFVVTPKGNLLPDDEAANIGRITFERKGIAALTTNAVRYHIGKPALEPPQFPRPKSGSNAVDLLPTLEWTGAGRGESFDVFLWFDGAERPTQPLVQGLADPAYRLEPPNLQPGFDYRWQVVARIADLQAASEVWIFSTVSPPTECPATPTELTAKIEEEAVHFRWSGSQHPEAAYVVSVWPKSAGDVAPTDSVRAAGIAANELRLSRQRLEPDVPLAWQVATVARGCPSRTARDELELHSMPTFQRGHATGADTLSITDPIRILSYLFLGDAAPLCAKAADADDNGKVEITDAIRILSYLFLGGAEPPAPFQQCGTDPTPDDLRCEAFKSCSGTAP